MILDRWYGPSDGELIYHYCGPDAFLAITRSRTLWLSASYVLNDSTERHWGQSVFAAACRAIEKETGKEFLEQIWDPALAAYRMSALMIGCFSLDADVLSQWRAYADDARGFAIGFDPKQLAHVPAKQLRVAYDEKAQIQELTGNLKHVYEVEKAKHFEYGEEFKTHLFNMGMDLCAYKHPAFREEREVRLAHTCVMAPAGKSLKFIKAGSRGPNGERLAEPLETNFRVSNGAVVPYVVANYSNGSSPTPIKEIVLGPKNENNELNVELFLNTIGLDGIRVRRSTAPYR